MRPSEMPKSRLQKLRHRVRLYSKFGSQADRCDELYPLKPGSIKLPVLQASGRNQAGEHSSRHARGQYEQSLLALNQTMGPREGSAKRGHLSEDNIKKAVREASLHRRVRKILLRSIDTQLV